MITGDYWEQLAATTLLATVELVASTFFTIAPFTVRTFPSKLPSAKSTSNKQRNTPRGKENSHHSSHAHKMILPHDGKGIQCTAADKRQCCKENKLEQVIHIPYELALAPEKETGKPDYHQQYNDKLEHLSFAAPFALAVALLSAGILPVIAVASLPASPVFLIIR